MAILIIVDVQNDFCPGGALPAPNGHNIIPKINRLMKSGKFKTIIATKDMHKKGDPEFNTFGVHCLYNSKGADFPCALDADNIDVCIYKKDLSGLTTSMKELLTYKCFENVYICGIATEYCVECTTMDIRQKTDAEVFIIQDACASIMESVGERAITRMEKAGIHILNVGDV